MKYKDELKVEQVLTEKYQLKDVAWALKQMAVRKIRIQARQDGLDTITEPDINALIKKTRTGRKKR